MWTTLFLYFVLPVGVALCFLRLKSVQKFLEPLRNRLYYYRFTANKQHSHSHEHEHGHGHSHDHGNGQCNGNHGQTKCNGHQGQGHRHESGQGKCGGQQGQGHGHQGHEQAKTILFQDLKTSNSKVKELEGKGIIRILELGVGQGANFKYYPEKCEYIGVDPNTSFRPDVTDNLKKFPGIELVNFLHTGAEEMDSIPDESVDAVVTTGVLCSVKDVQKAFKQIRRVLVPGGKYYYLEHIAEEHNSKKYWMQKIVTLAYQAISFTGLMHAAHMDRKIDEEVLKAGFSSVDQKYSRLEMNGSVLQKLAERLAIGVAVK